MAQDDPTQAKRSCRLAKASAHKNSEAFTPRYFSIYFALDASKTKTVS